MSLSLAAVLAESAQRYPDRTAVVLDDESVTYEQLWQRSRQYAAVLRARKIAPGDPVALLCPNVPEFAAVYYAILAVGGVVVPLHVLLTPEDIAFAVEDSGAEILVCAFTLLGQGLKGAHLAGVPLLSVRDLHGDQDDVERLEELGDAAVPLEGYVKREPDDEAVIIYTSGTTGQPKGAVLTHLNLVMNAQLCATDVVHLSQQDVVLGCLPLFHSFGQTCCMNAGFRAGATVVLMTRFDGRGALERMVTHGVTIFQGVPTMYRALLEAAAADDRRPPLRLATSGGAPISVDVMDEFEKVFGAAVYEGYGLSETAPVATFNQPAYGRKPGTVGRPIWGVDVEIAQADVEDRIQLLPVGEEGEVVIRGHNVMPRYHDRRRATAEAIVDGWFRSGDLGTRDADGFITIVGRKKDMVLRGGFNVYPREIEEVLIRHPAVAEVAVIPIPDEQFGEEVCALVVRTPDYADRSDREVRTDILGWSRDKLARYKHPHRLDFVEALPHSASGRVVKSELIERYRHE